LRDGTQPTRTKDEGQPSWTFDEIPDQTGRTAVVTGANTGIGFETARMLALKGARVVLACRIVEKGDVALERIRNESPTANVSAAPLDLADLDSVAKATGASTCSSTTLGSWCLRSRERDRASSFSSAPTIWATSL